MKKFYRNLSKGKILVELEGQLNSFRVPKTKVIKVSDWLYNKDKILIFIRDYFFHKMCCDRALDNNDNTQPLREAEAATETGPDAV